MILKSINACCACCWIVLEYVNRTIVLSVYSLQLELLFEITVLPKYHLAHICVHVNDLFVSLKVCFRMLKELT